MGYSEITDLLQNAPNNIIIIDNLIRAWHIINNPIYERICCSVSGGSDSDIMLDICYRCDKDNKIYYVWYDTGLEYQATKDRLKYKDSYEYTRKYREFCEKMNKEERNI